MLLLSLDIQHIAAKANQPGWDIEIKGPDQEVINQIQLKASSSVEYVKSHFDKYLILMSSHLKI